MKMDEQKVEMTLEEQINNIQKFLSEFDNPLVIQLPEKGQRIPDMWTNKDFYDLVARNIDWKCWLHFCPNWSRWKINKVWETIIRKEKDAPEDWIITALVLDFDYKDYTDRFDTKEELLKRTSWLTLVDSKRPRYVMDSGWWAHVYYFISKESREQCNMVYWKDLLKISEMASKIYKADEWCVASFKINWTIRLPYSYNNKYDKPHLVEPFYVNDKGEADDLTYEDCERLITYVSTQMEQVKKKESLKLSMWSKADIDWINMEDMIEKLKDYPREMPDGRLQVFEIDKDNVIIYDIDNVTDKNILKKTKWNSYKYNRQWNYIHCFCMWDPLEAPEGNGFGFLYYYFCKDVHKVENFLLTEYGLSLNKNNDWLNISSVELRWTKFVFTESVVKALSNDEAEDKETSKVLFQNRVIPKGKWYIYQFKIWEVEEQQLAVIFEIDWIERTIIPQPSKRDHNKNYWYMFCYGADNLLAQFFRAIELDENIPRINIYEKNWFYDDVVLLWWKAIEWNLWDGRISTRYEYDIVWEEKEQISVHEFFELYKWIYDKSIVYPTFLQALALSWMNMWEWMNCYPAMLITWLTGSGKTSIMQIMKSMLWYAENARTFSLPWLTPQPLKQAASDYSILFLEELTNKVWEQTEELLRNIVNHDKASRWHYDQNIEFNLFSPLLVVWERTFKDESLNNRFVTTVINRSNWIADAREKMQEILTKSASIDIYKTRFHANKDEINKAYREVTVWLSRKGLDSRNADTYAYMFVTKNVFNIDIGEEELFEIVNAWIKKTWVAQSTNINDSWIIKTFIIRAILNSKANITLTNEWKNALVEIIFLDEDIYERNKWKLNTAIYNVNSIYWKEMFSIDSNGLFCQFDALYTSGWMYAEECKDIMTFRSSIFDSVRGSKLCHIMSDLDL